MSTTSASCSSGGRAGDEAARLAFDVFVHRLKHYVGAYLAHPRRLDVLVFTAGIGQNSPPCGPPSPTGWTGSASPSTRHATRPLPRGPGDLARRLPVVVAVVPTNEELAIARQAASLLAAQTD